MEVMASPWKSAQDSPSRQLLRELNHLAISSQEGFQARLDRENDERASIHKNALASAAAKHERVIRNVELERERLELQVRAERYHREEQARKEIEDQRREQAEREAARKRREAEQAKALEDEQLRLAKSKQIAEEDARRKAEAQRQEKEQRDAELAKRLQEAKKAEERKTEKLKIAEARARDQSTAQSARIDTNTTSQNPANTSTTQLVPDTSKPAPSSDSTGGDTRNASLEVEHQNYLTIHQRLKNLRKFMTAEGAKRPELKRLMGDLRRSIKKSVGQLRPPSVAANKKTNTKPLSSIIDALKEAIEFGGPKADVTSFLISPPPQIDDHSGPGLLLYLLNILAKALISQLIDEAGVSPEAGDAVGIVASHIFALNNFRWNGQSLIDIFIAKYHVVSPVIFGMYGPETTVQGKTRLGWSREEPGGPFVPQQRHYERMIGLGSGFAALSLRNYSKAAATNPYPEHHYWRALANIANLPASELTETHFIVAKAMIENYEDKFIGFYGAAAIAALRLLLIELPKRAPASVASKSLAGLVDVFQRKKNLTI